MSAFRRGSTDAADFAAVPNDVGIRLVRTGDATEVRSREISRLAWRDGRPVRILEQMVLTPDSTEVRELSAQPLDDLPIRVVARPGDQAAADAAVRAVLRRGLRLPPAGLLEPIEVEWPGSVEGLAAEVKKAEEENETN